MMLETERLRIREFTLDDMDAFAPMMADPLVMEYSLSGPLSREGAQDYLETRILEHYKKHGYGLWAIVEKASEELIGLVGPINQNIEGEECVEIGYRLLPSQWGKGYAIEAIQAVRDHIFAVLHLDKIVAIIDPKNVRSVRAAERSGYTLAKQTTFHGFKVNIYEVRP